MRRILIGLLPLAMAAAALFAAVPAANAAVGLPATSCPTYGPGPCTATITVTVTYNGDIVTLHVSGGQFKPGEQVDITVSVPSRNVGALTANNLGDISGAIVLPAGYSAGTHGLDALGTISGIVGSASFTLTEASGTLTPCTTSFSTANSSAVVLAAAYLSAACKTAAPAAVPPAVATPHSASQLPFTGFNAATAAASGAILIGAGGALVLMSRRRRRAAWK